MANEKIVVLMSTYNVCGGGGGGGIILYNHSWGVLKATEVLKFIFL